MRAVIVGAGMGGLMTALALRQSGVFASVDIYEQTKVPSTAGAGLNIPPNGARICRWLGVDLDGGDPKGPDGVLDGGRAATLESTRQFNADGSVTKRPFDHVTAAGDSAGLHHMHRLDLLMCLYKRVFEFAPDSGAPCPITVHMDCRLTQVRQTAGTGPWVRCSPVQHCRACARGLWFRRSIWRQMRRGCAVGRDRLSRWAADARPKFSV